jgi:hypothetical protein
MALTADDFWKLIGHIDHDALERGDEDAAAEPLGSALQRLSDQELFAFEEQLAQALYALDGRKYADESGESRGSDDGFLYARCYVVGCGKANYEAVLAEPALMPKTTDGWFEGLLTVAEKAFKQRGGGEWTFLPSVSHETGSNEEMW